VRSLLGLVALLALPPGARAADGALPINQACAAGPGCFPGDAPGFPVEIEQPGSYVLTGPLNVPDENTTAIALGADHVELDLAGFAIRGTTTCVLGFPGLELECTPSTGSGVGVAGASARWARVRDGFVSGMGDAGVVLGAGARVEGITARESRTYGILVFAGSAVERCIARRNGGRGIATLDRASVVASVATGNGLSGIQTGDGAAVRACASGDNQSGIVAGAWAMVEASVSSDNDGLGIEVGRGSAVRSSATDSNTGDGSPGVEISAAEGASVMECAAEAAIGGTALSLGGDTGYGGNALDGAVSSGIEVGDNVCDEALCP
jgi:hypothetical protein